MKKLKATPKVEPLVPNPLKTIKWSSARTKFNYLAGINRPIIPQHVTKLADSICNMGMLRPIVIATIDFLPQKGDYVIDGQHSSVACMRLNMPIPYVKIIVKDKSDLIEKIAKLNASSKTWTMQDYVIAWANLHNDYKKLNDYFKQYDFELNILASVFMNMEMSNNTTKTIKNGNFRIKNESESVKLLDYMTDLFNVLDRGSRFEIKYLCNEYYKFYRSAKNYNHAKFMAHIRKNKNKLDFMNLESGKLVKVFQTYC